MFLEYLFIFGISLLPLIELRGAIPVGIGMGLSPLLVFFTAVIADIFLGFILIELFFWLDKWVPKWTFLRIGKHYSKFREKTHKKVKRFTEKYGMWGVALFIAIPLPGSGVYTGTLGAFLIDLDKRHYKIACVIGVFLAGIVVTLISMGAFGLLF